MNDYWKKTLEALLYLYSSDKESSKNLAFEQLKKMAERADYADELEEEILNKRSYDNNMRGDKTFQPIREGVARFFAKPVLYAGTVD